MRPWLVVCTSGLVSCSLVVSTDDYDATEHAPRSYAVGGTVDGLGGARVTLLLNGGNPTESADGRFTFPPVLLDGAPYAVTTQAQPAGHACTLERAAGAIATKDVDDVVVRCPSTDAALESLTLSAGALSPVFDSKVHDYVVDVKVPSTIFPAAPRTITLAARPRDPGARVSIAGVLTAAGVASPPLSLRQGDNPFDVLVRAADPTSPPVRYRASVQGFASDYLKPSTPIIQAGFGSNVVLDGDTLVVAAPFESTTTESSAGAVYVFGRTNGQWSQTAVIKPPISKYSVFFGSAIALHGDTLVVGAYGEQSKSSGVNGDETPDPTCELVPQPGTCFQNTGAVYVYTRAAGGAWTKQAYLKSPTPQAYGSFGYALGFDGDTITVGAYGEDVGTEPSAGKVHVFGRSGSTWTAKPSIVSGTPTRFGSFGQTIALEGDTLAVGAPAEQSGVGRVYLFTRSAGVWTRRDPNGQSCLSGNGSFGDALALSKGTLVIGDSYDRTSQSGVNPPGPMNTDATFSGAAHVYIGADATWTKQAFIKASNNRAGIRFGSVLAVRDDALAIGAFQEPGGSRGVGGDPKSTSIAAAGAVYVFGRTAGVWTQKSYVKASNPQPGAYFGSSIALSADTLVVGAQEESSKATGVNGKPQDDSSVPSAGAVYAF